MCSSTQLIYYSTVLAALHSFLPTAGVCSAGVPAWSKKLEEFTMTAIEASAGNSTCTKHRKDLPLNNCTNLLPAGDATGSLVSGLHGAAPDNPKFYHHHTIHIESGIPCYIIPIRSPASRFQSGFRLLLSRSWKDPDRSTFDKLAFFNSSDNFVHAIRDPTHLGHRKAMEMYLGAVEGGGSHFLSPQISYLHGLDCSKMEIHFVCVEHMSDDWKTLMDTFGIKNNTLGHAHGRSRNGKDTALLGAEETDFVNKCMYPWDTAMHSRLCG